MRSADHFRFALTALLRQRFRTAMLLLTMAIGVASVLILTAAGEGARGYVTDQFSFLGKDVLVILPGRKETTGGLPPITGTTVRDITLEDALWLPRAIPGIADVAPLVIGGARVSHGGLGRDSIVVGSSHALFTIRELGIARGRALPATDLFHPVPYVVLGHVLVDELFPEGSAIGRRVRIGDRSFQVIGLLADSGDALGMDMGEAAIIPVASAMELFDLSGLFRVLVQVRPNADREQVQAAIEDEMAERHHGKPDITVITPDALLAAFDDILRVLTLGVGAIGAISLVVAGILMMNVTVINVRQRTHEIGLLKALGGTPRQIRRIFLLEAALASLGGGLIGFGVAGVALAAALKAWPTIPFAVPVWAILAALGLALVIGTGFAAIPARQAARYAPMDALRTRV